MSAQAAYTRNGVKIVRPRKTEIQFKFILPAFIHEPMSKLVHGRHFFHSLKELQIFHPDPTKIHEINTQDPAYAFKLDDDEDHVPGLLQKRKRVPNKRYVSDDPSTALNSKDHLDEQVVDVPPSTAVNGKLLRLRHHCLRSGCNMYPCEIDDPTLAPCGGCREAVGSVHQCIHCGSNIHPWCGVSTGEEGYGQSIICPNCIVAGK